MKHIAIIGYGVVGGGITEVIDSSRAQIASAIGDEINVKYILDLRDFPDSPYADRVVHDISAIALDDEVSLVCETMGGSHPAYEFSVRCMEAGKSVVTSNKEVVANYGDELLECAKKNGVYYMFEASVGGGIPCLRPFYTSLSGVVISKISGIVNGTTNFILTKMRDEGRDFSEVLEQAQALGYAERDPSADIDGIDAKRKITILGALVSGKLAAEDEVDTVSLRDVTQDDLNAARMLDGEIKYIATVSFGEQNEYSVCPTIVKHTNPLSHVSGVYNGVLVTSPLTGDIMYYGRGAGRLPTAGAVISDVIAILSGAVRGEKLPVFEKSAGIGRAYSGTKQNFYVRARMSATELEEKLSAVAESAEIIQSGGVYAEAVACGVVRGELDKVLPGARVLPILD